MFSNSSEYSSYNEFAIFLFFFISEHFQILLFLKHGFKDKRFANLFRKVVKIPKVWIFGKRQDLK
jgi:hypothetical protein